MTKIQVTSSPAITAANPPTDPPTTSPSLSPKVLPVASPSQHSRSHSEMQQAQYLQNATNFRGSIGMAINLPKPPTPAAQPTTTPASPAVTGKKLLLRSSTRSLLSPTHTGVYYSLPESSMIRRFMVWIRFIGVLYYAVVTPFRLGISQQYDVSTTTVNPNEC